MSPWRDRQKAESLRLFEDMRRCVQTLREPSHGRDHVAQNAVVSLHAILLVFIRCVFAQVCRGVLAARYVALLYASHVTDHNAWHVSDCCCVAAGACSTKALQRCACAWTLLTPTATLTTWLPTALSTLHTHTWAPSGASTLRMTTRTASWTRWRTSRIRCALWSLTHGGQATTGCWMRWGSTCHLCGSTHASTLHTT